MTKAKQYLDRAKREKWAIGAFNASNIETLKAILGAAKKLEAPVIVESSPGETEFFGATALSAVVNNYRAELDVPAFINLDHATDLGKVDEAIEAGYELIHFDGGKFEFDENLKQTKELAAKVHRSSLLLEGEIDHITGSSSVHKKKSEAVQAEGRYTEPAQAAEFVNATNVDTLAVFVGNIHGIYSDSPKLDFDRLEKIRAETKCFLSLHGGSGIKDADIKKAVSLGIQKVNVNSELRLAYLKAMQVATRSPTEIAPYKYLQPVIEEVQKVVEKKIKLFGSAGKAKKQWVRRSI